MKQLTIALLTVFFTFSAFAQSSEETRQAALAQTLQKIKVLNGNLERAENEKELYKIRMELREEFKSLDKLVLSGPLFKTTNQ